jgi:hypothetical protein
LKESGRIIVIERVVEDWLHNVNELGYEDSFAHALIAEGHTIIHKQQHGQLELGKDLITKDPSGVFHCYQLKGGNITQSKWEAISGQIHLTVTSPIIHPNIPLDAPFVPRLVSNGTISDPVRLDITARNQVWKKQHDRELQLILYDGLLDMFLKVPASFLPAKPRDFQLFLTLYLADKREPLKCNEFSHFLLSLVPETESTKAELRRLLAATTIVADYVISEYEKVGNHYVAAQAWALLFFHLLRICEPYATIKDWMPAIELVTESMNRCISQLVDEVLGSTNLMEGNMFVDEHVWLYRLTSLIGMLAAQMISRRLSGTPLEKEDHVYGFIAKQISKFKLWGEVASPALFLAAECLCLRGAESAGISTVFRAVETITRENGTKDGIGLPDPYYDAEELLKFYLFNEDVFGEKVTFAKRSYSIRQFVEFVVRRNWPKALQQHWYAISNIDFAEFRPEHPFDAYLWGCKDGSSNSRRWARPQSWTILVTESLSATNDCLLIDTKFIELLPYYFMFMPHRFTPSRAKLMDNKLLSMYG